MIQYPDYLPIPLRDGYGFNPVSPIVGSKLVTGRSRKRRGYVSVPTFVSVQWLMTDLQARMFEAWWEEILISGTQWFEMPLKTPLGGLQLYACRFTDIYRDPTLVGVSLWRFTAELELRKRPILPPGWISIAPDFIRYADIFDRAMNQEWPAFDFDYETYAAALASIGSLSDGQRISIRADETQGGAHAYYTVQKLGSSASLILDFLNAAYYVTEGADALILQESWQ